MSVASQSDTVSASELVRHFGLWRDRASRTPVHILHHGRPQLLLASVDAIDRLTQTGGEADRVQAVLDALGEPALLVTRDGRVEAAGRAARACFGAALAPGADLAEALPVPVGSHLARMVARVADTGLREQGELPAEGQRAGRIEIAVEPLSSSVLISGRAAGLADARDAALAQLQALATAVTALPGTAFATIGPRGHLLSADQSLAELTGFAPRAFEGLRAVTLFGVGSRVAVGDAIEAAFALADPQQLTAELLTDRAGPLPVEVGLAPLRHGLTTVAVVVALARRPAELSA